MKCDVSSLFSGSCRRIVFVDSMEDSLIVEKAVLDAYPQYKVEINDAFSGQKKVGPFRLKNKKTVWKILWNTKAVSNAVRNHGREDGVALLEEKMNLMDLNFLADRMPRVLSDGQRLRASVLYDLLNGRSEFLLNDSYATVQGERVANKGKDSYFSIERSVAHHEAFQWIGYDLIRITDMPVQRYFEELGDDAVLACDGCYFTFENGSLVLQNGEDLRKSCVHPAPSKTPEKSGKVEIDSKKPEYSEAHKAEKDKYLNQASALIGREAYDEAWSVLCRIRDRLSSDYRQDEVDGLFAMCDSYLSRQEEEELRNTVENARKDVGEKNYRRAKTTLELYKKFNPGEENEEINRLLNLCERALNTPPDRPYLRVLDLDIAEDGTTAVVARMVKGSVSVEDVLVHHGTGKSYSVARFRTVDDLERYITEIDENEGRSFVFSVKDEFYEIEPDDWFYKG